MLANLIGFAVFWAYPVAPPRMLPGFIDVVQKRVAWVLGTDTLINTPTSSRPCPPCTSAMRCGAALVAWRLARRWRARVAAMVFGIGYPLLTALVVMSTGNHYLLDVLAGTGTVVVAGVVLEMVPRSVRRLRAEGVGAEQASNMRPPAERVGYAAQRGNAP